MNKFMTIVFIVLLVVIFAEVGYFFYETSGKNNQSKSSTTKTIITPSKAPIFVDERRVINQLVINELVADLKILKKGVLKSSVITNIYEGKIISIKKPSESAGNTTEMASIMIEGKEGYKNTFFFPREDILRMKIFEDKDQRIPMKFESLNINDSITLELNSKIYSNEKYDISSAELTTITKN